MAPAKKSSGRSEVADRVVIIKCNDFHVHIADDLHGRPVTIRGGEEEEKRKKKWSFASS